MRPQAPRRLVILTEGQFAPHSGKTAFGVIRYGRDEVVAVLDSTLAGRNVADWLPGHDIPIVASLGEALDLPARPRPDTLLIGIAPTGGRLPGQLARRPPRRDRRRPRAPLGAPPVPRRRPRASSAAAAIAGVRIVDYRRPPSNSSPPSGACIDPGRGCS